MFEQAVEVDVYRSAALLLGCSAVGHLAGYDAGSFDGQEITIVELQLSILDDKCPDFIALSICVQVALSKSE